MMVMLVGLVSADDEQDARARLRGAHRKPDERRSESGLPGLCDEPELDELIAQVRIEADDSQI